MIGFYIILRYWWYAMFSGVFWACYTIIASPNSFYTLFNHFYVLWCICAPVGGQALTGPIPLSVVNTPFLQIISDVRVRMFLVYPCILFWVLGMLVWFLFVAPPSEVVGSYFLLFHCFGLCFSCLKFGFSIIFPW